MENPRKTSVTTTLQLSNKEYISELMRIPLSKLMRNANFANPPSQDGITSPLAKSKVPEKRCSRGGRVVRREYVKKWDLEDFSTRKEEQSLNNYSQPLNYCLQVRDHYNEVVGGLRYPLVKECAVLRDFEECPLPRVRVLPREDNYK